MAYALRKLGFLVALVIGLCLLCGRDAMAGQGQGTLIGTVTDAANKEPLPDVTVVATSAALQGPQTVLTDSSGHFRVPNLPPGDYSLSFDLEGYKPYGRGSITVRADSTIRLNAQMLPTTLQAEEVTVVGEAPSIDVASSATGANVDKNFIKQVPNIRPGTKGAAQRSFESLAETTPGASNDQYGSSMNGTTSPENNYVIDGVSVNDPAYGILGTPLSIDFIEEVNVITGGYMPEFGRSTGGILDVVTKSGSNEFHGSVFTYLTPGAMEGPRTQVRTNGQTIRLDTKLMWVNDFGFDFGGPILKDKLWFYTGFDIAFQRYKIHRTLSRIHLDPNTGEQALDADGFTVVDELPGTAQDYFATSKSLQYMGKLTYQVSQEHNLTLTVYGVPSWSGGGGDMGIDSQQDVPENQVLDMYGDLRTIRHRFQSWANDLSLKYSGAFDDKNWLLDASFGWHHQHGGTKPSDGSNLGDREGLAGLARVSYRRAIDADGNYYPHSITDFERLPDPAACNPPPGSTLTTLCPVDTYQYGGPDYIDDSLLNRYQLRAVVTRLQQGAGHHVIKGGIDLEFMTLDHSKTYSGGRRFREGLDGSYFSDNRMYGFLQGPDDAVPEDPQTRHSLSTTFGGFLQDSWAIMDVVTVNAGLRYDAQMLFGDDGKMGMALPNEWSPRIGAIYDFTQKGQSKIFANYAMFYESVPLDLVDRSFPGERQILSLHDAATCDPRDPAQQRGACTAQSNLIPLSSADDPNQLWSLNSSDKVPVDPNVKPQSSSEFVAGAEYELFPKATIGVAYTRRWMNNVIEDMSRDEGQTYFIGNPGSGIASDFPTAKRTYDGMSLYFEKKFAGDDLVHWLVSGSYTLSYLRGNWAGLFRPETGQLDPNINSDFDIISILPNREGVLPGDTRHALKIFGATQFTPDKFIIDLGVGWRSWSGGPTNYLGAHETYGEGEVFILPRGSGDRLPWVHRFDTHLGFGMKLGKQSTMLFSMDVFNLFNFQAVTQVDQNYTLASVLPIPDGTTSDLGNLKHADGSPVGPNEINPNFGKPSSYQSPRSFRFGLKATF